MLKTVAQSDAIEEGELLLMKENAGVVGAAVNAARAAEEYRRDWIASRA